jgi:ParB family chromosome partitioning protein
MLASGALSMGHARALIGTADPAALAEEVVKRDLSVRDAEKLVRSGKPRKVGEGPVGYQPASADIEALERQLGDMLGLKVKIATRPAAAPCRSLIPRSTNST